MQSTRLTISPPLAVLIGAIIACVSVAVSLLLMTQSKDGDVVIIANPVLSEVVVEIRGEVRSPGVYRLPEDSRVGDLLAAAGGANGDANLSSVNLARRLVDAEQIVILAISSATPLAATVGNTGSGPAAGIAYRININTASGADLETLPGIGPVIAQRIVDYRTIHGPFADVADLAQVEGVSQSLLADIRSLITIGP